MKMGKQIIGLSQFLCYSKARGGIIYCPSVYSKQKFLSREYVFNWTFAKVLQCIDNGHFYEEG